MSLPFDIRRIRLLPRSAGWFENITVASDAAKPRDYGKLNDVNFALHYYR